MIETHPLHNVIPLESGMFVIKIALCALFHIYPAEFQRTIQLVLQTLSPPCLAPCAMHL